MADEIVLYGNEDWTSPYVFSAFVCLKEKGVPFQVERLDLAAGQHHRPEYAVPSFTGRVPALRHGDFWLAESSAIDEYLEDVFPPPRHAALYPADPRERAKVRMVQAFVRSDVAPLRADRPTSTLFSGDKPGPLSKEGKAAADRLVAVAERFLPAGAQYVAGAFSIADADLALMLQRLVHNHDPCPERLATYAREIFRRPSIREWLGHTRWQER
ncbi:glutathione transferase [Anaeromyxobacter oryzae]|uniref:Glutathione S-transferase n=1 Tax=Anaeromyxobacter oryzae TaxID=2918170 RepID=A0ABM7WZ91_9BACT|nr:glutathione transferase [Anaeromyxobacter oryzae]BDG04854.1 glutathione S-transferase [Anaeromyxobacter oryzae]